MIVRERIWKGVNGNVKGIVYRVTNKVDGRFYVGQTTRGLTFRKWFHINDRRHYNSPFHKAIERYGEGAFEWEVLYEIDRPTRLELVAELDRLEKIEIDMGNPLCYNQSSGGWSGFTITDDVRDRISDGVKASMTKERRQKIGQTTRENLSRPVARYTVEGVLLTSYESATEAAAKTRLSRTAIRECCLGKTKTAGGWKWAYVIKEKDGRN